MQNAELLTRHGVLHNYGADVFQDYNLNHHDLT